MSGGWWMAATALAVWTAVELWEKWHAAHAEGQEDQDGDDEEIREDEGDARILRVEERRQN